MAHLYLFISHPIAHTCVKLIEGFPSELIVREVLCCLNCSLKCRSPDLDESQHTDTGSRNGVTHSQWCVTNVVRDQCRQSPRIAHAPFRQWGIASDFTFHVELTFTVLHGHGCQIARLQITKNVARTSTLRGRRRCSVALSANSSNKMRYDFADSHV